MAVSTTLFKNIYDNKTTNRLDFDSFEIFENALYKLAEKPFASKRDAPLMSPAIYQSDTTRANDNVIEWAGWAAVAAREAAALCTNARRACRVSDVCRSQTYSRAEENTAVPMDVSRVSCRDVPQRESERVQGVSV